MVCSAPSIVELQAAINRFLRETNNDPRPFRYVYPDDPRPDVHDLMARYRAKYGIDMNCIRQTGVSVAQIALAVLQRAGGPDG